MKQTIAAFVLGLMLCASKVSHAQVRFSIGTDISVMRHLAERQQFWTLGQTVQGNFHLTPRHSGYVWINYFVTGKFSNAFTATAKQPVTVPQQRPYTVNGSLRISMLSLGWKPYLKGTFNNEEGLNIYGLAGFGLAFIRAENTSSNFPDTALYQPAVFAEKGSKSFRRLTVDVGVGAEQSIGGGIYLYGDLRGILPVSSQSSSFFHSDAPLPKAIIASAGIRVLIGN